MYAPETVRRFWAKVDMSGDCWEWLGSVRPAGHGRFSIGRQSMPAHRFAFEIAFSGPLPPFPEALVCHDCDNPKCVRADHLYLGTVKSNAQDASRRNRLCHGLRWRSAHMATMCRGEANNQARLTAEQVEEIRERFTGKYGQVIALAREYGVSRQSIGQIVHYNTWRHV